MMRPGSAVRAGVLATCISACGVLYAAESAPVTGNSADQFKQAAQMREKAKAIRAEALGIREHEDYDCKTNAFFVNNCLAKSRDRYIERITPARQLEIDANSVEKEAKTLEKEEKDAESAANPPRPSAKPIPEESAPHAMPGPTGTPITPGESIQPKPTAKPLDPAEQAAHEQQKQAERAKEAQQAAQRAQKAAEDKAQYEKRAREAAQRKAEREKKQAEKNAAQSAPPTTP